MLLPLIAIDGPAGVGKTTTARGVANRLGIPYLDTGAMYRAAACLVLRSGVSPRDAGAVSRLLERTKLTCVSGAKGIHVWLNDVEVTEELRSSNVTRAVGEVCEIPEARRHLVELQRRWAARGFGIIEGRDIGTVVLPQAGLKVFLTAKPEVRALRRSRDLGITDDSEALTRLTRELAERDRRDRERADSPLRQAQDAVRIDTSEMTLPEQVDCLVRLAAERFGLSLIRTVPDVD